MKTAMSRRHIVLSFGGIAALSALGIRLPVAKGPEEHLSHWLSKDAPFDRTSATAIAEVFFRQRAGERQMDVLVQRLMETMPDLAHSWPDRSVEEIRQLVSRADSA